MSTTKYHAAKISPSGGDVAAGNRRGAFPMWRPCRGSPSRAKLVPGLHIKGLSNKSPDRCRRRGFTVLPLTGGIINSLPLKGKRLTTFCASLTLLHPLLSLTHWIFRSLTLPYKSSSHSAKCVRCAPRSGNPQPSGHKPVKPKNLFPWPFYTTCRRQAVPTCGVSRALFTCGGSRHHNPQPRSGCQT